MTAKFLKETISLYDEYSRVDLEQKGFGCNLCVIDSKTHKFTSLLVNEAIRKPISLI